jgi:hypothetical protein
MVGTRPVFESFSPIGAEKTPQNALKVLVLSESYPYFFREVTT